MVTCVLQCLLKFPKLKRRLDLLDLLIARKDSPFLPLVEMGQDPILERVLWRTCGEKEWRRQRWGWSSFA